jgi:NNP family nitrate/nitrite transporter-like MFS transporter
MPEKMSNKFTPVTRPFLKLFIVWLAMFSASFAQWQLPPLAAKIIPLLDLTMTQFSSLVTAPMIPAILFSILAGVMCDKFGIKRVLSVGIILGAIGISARLSTSNYIQMLLCMVFSGCGAAFINANIVKMVGAWFPPEQLGKKLGILLTSATFGMTMGMGTSSLFPSVNSAFLFSSILCVISVLLWLLFMDNDHRFSTKSADVIEPNQEISLIALLKVPAKSAPLWIVGLCLMLVVGSMMAFMSFLPAALSQTKGLSDVSAGATGSAFMIGTLLSAILSPIIANKVGFYRPYFFVLGILAAVGVYWGWQASNEWLWLSMLLTGFCVGGSVPVFMSFPMLLQDIGPKYSGGAGGLIATIQLTGGVSIPYIISSFANDNYQLLFTSAAGCLAAMSLLSLSLPEVGPKKQ